MLRLIGITAAVGLLLLCGCSAETDAPQASAAPTAVTTDDVHISEETTESGQVLITRIGVFSGDGGEIVQQDSTHSAAMPDQNAVLCTGGDMTLSRVNVTKSGDAPDPDGAESSGMNAAVAAAGGSVRLIDAVVTANALAADALSAIGENSAIDAANTYIVTTGSRSAGIVALDAGKVMLDSCSVATDGADAPCAVIGGVFTATNAKLRAAQSNSLVLISGGQALISNCEIIGAAGIYVRNDGAEPADMTLENCLFVTADERPLVMDGGTVNLTLKKQQLNGTLAVAGGELTLKLTEGSNFSGTIAADEPRQISVSLDESSVWNVSAETEIGVLTNADASLQNIHSNGFTVYYDASLAENGWLNSTSLSLPGGGFLVPRI